MEERKRKEGKGKRGRKGRSTFKTAVKIMKNIEIKLTKNALRFFFFFRKCFKISMDKITNYY